MKTDKILLDHGSGGRVSHDLIEELIVPHFSNSILSKRDDSAILTLGEKVVAFSTDSYTVDPIFFPGGDIGNLAINGTVNDLAMSGARPLYISVGFIIEEGFPVTDLKKILESMRRSADEAEVSIVTGDTKVVPRGAADRIFINTAGIGIIPDGVDISGENAQPGDRIILSGHIADHGMAVLTQREGIMLTSSLQTDTAPLGHMVAEMIAVGKNLHTLRDPTRGGIGTSLNEIAIQSGVGVKIFEDLLPIRDGVRGACELLGFDPLYMANEGKLLACVDPVGAERTLAIVQENKYGKDAAIIGEVVPENPGKVTMRTLIGGTRIVDMLSGEQLPRIC